MEFLFFGAIIVAFILYVAVTKWSSLQFHLFIVWALMALQVVGVTLYALLR